MTKMTKNCDKLMKRSKTTFSFVGHVLLFFLIPLFSFFFSQKEKFGQFWLIENRNKGFWEDKSKNDNRWQMICFRWIELRKIPWNEGKNAWKMFFSFRCFICRLFFFFHYLLHMLLLIREYSLTFYNVLFSLSKNNTFLAFFSSLFNWKKSMVSL